MFPLRGNNQNESMDDLGRQEKRLKLQLVLIGISFLLFALLWSTLMLDAVHKCITLGCDVRVPLRPFAAGFTVPVRFYIGQGLFMLAVVLPIFPFWYREVAENLAEVRARMEFERTMERIRAGEDIDHIVQDLKRRRK